DPSVIGYDVFRGTSPGGEDGTPINASPVTTTSFPGPRPACQQQVLALLPRRVAPRQDCLCHKESPGRRREATTREEPPWKAAHRKASGGMAAVHPQLLRLIRLELENERLRDTRSDVDSSPLHSPGERGWQEVTEPATPPRPDETGEVGPGQPPDQLADAR